MIYSRARFWVGCKVTGRQDGTTGREVFKAKATPTEASHGGRYLLVWGPFETRRGAEFAAGWEAVGNPHVVTVQDAERIARRLGGAG